MSRSRGICWESPAPNSDGPRKGQTASACALAIRPDWAEAHCNLGNTLREQGKLDEAVPHFRRAVELKPDHAEACTISATP